ncbi:MAG: hypothetical protein AAF927_23890 [Bacteroidota bacterium]
MEKLKAYIELLPFLDKVALATWLSKEIETSAQEKAKNAELIEEGGTPPPAWMWEKAEESLLAFKNAEESGLSWEEVKALGNKRKSA